MDNLLNIFGKFEWNYEKFDEINKNDFNKKNNIKKSEKEKFSFIND